MTLQELVKNCFYPIWEKTGGEVDVNCCFCSDKKRRLGINVLTGVAHCFKCDFTSGDRKSVVNSKRRTFQKISEAFNYTQTFTLDEGEVDTSVESKEEELKQAAPVYQVRMPKEFEPLWKNVNDKESRTAYRYLRERRVTAKQIKRFKIGFCAFGYYSNRIVFPVYYKGELKGLVGRDYSGKADIKYLNSKGDKTFYNLPPRSKRKKTLLMVEGIFDVLACRRCKALVKEYDIIGVLGSKIPPKQLKLLSTYNNIVIWAEPDRAGVEGTIKRAKQLKQKNRLIEVIMPLKEPEEDSDPGGMKPEEILERVKGK